MARYTRTPVSTLQGINNELAKVELAMKDTLDRKGVTPNFMDANLDMNSRRVLNLPAPLTDQEPLRKGDLPTGLSVSSQYVDDKFLPTPAFLKAQGLSGNYGFFDKGFTYNEAGDVGIDSDGNIWTYNGALPFNVEKGTVPSVTAYTQYLISKNYTRSFDSIDAVKAYSNLSKLIGQRITTGEYHAGTGIGGASYDVVSSGSVTPNDIDIIQGIADSGAAISLVKSRKVDVAKYGAGNTAAESSTSSLKKAAQDSAGGTLFYPDGEYFQTDDVVVPVTANVCMSEGAYIVAKSEFDNVFVTEEGVASRRTYNLTNIDCGGLVKRPLYIRNGRDCDISATNIIAPTKDGLRLGDYDLDSLGRSYGHHITKYRVNRQLGATSRDPSGNEGTVGINEQSVTDVKGSNIEVVGFETAHFGAASGFYVNFHAWASQEENKMDYGFIPGSGAKYVNSYADQPQIAGWKINDDIWRVCLVSCKLFNSPNGGTANPNVVGVEVGSAVGALSCYGLELKGGATGIAQDFVISDSQLRSSAFDITGVTYENVTNKRLLIPATTKSERVELFDVNGDRVFIASYNESNGELSFYSDQSGSNALIMDSNGLTVGRTPSDKISFFGAEPAIRQSNVPVSVESIHAALVNLGLIT